MIRILVGGDVCPMGNIQNSFINGKADEIFHDLLEEIVKANLSVVNLECPLLSQNTPIAKVGPVLGSSTRCIEGFVAARWNVLNLANNHSYDHGTKGLLETIHTIKSAGLNVVGAGVNIQEAQSPFVTRINNKRIIIYSMAEREFSFADEDIPGANPLDLINFMNALRLYKQQGTFIVLIHGGNEYYPYPSPEMVRRCHFMIDMGADAIICCHSHCPLPWERYAGRPIVYGLGNLIFEASRKEPDTWFKGYLASLTIEDDCVGFEAIPYCQSNGFLGAQKMDQKAQEDFFVEMQVKKVQLTDESFIKGHWVRYCRQQREHYLSKLFAYNKIMRKFRSILLPTLHSEEGILRALLMAQCEAHREILNTLLRDERERFD